MNLHDKKAKILIDPHNTKSGETSLSYCQEYRQRGDIAYCSKKLYGKNWSQTSGVFIHSYQHPSEKSREMVSDKLQGSVGLR
jgi:hypothetical protein